MIAHHNDGQNCQRANASDQPLPMRLNEFGSHDDLLELLSLPTCERDGIVVQTWCSKRAASSGRFSGSSAAASDGQADWMDQLRETVPLPPTVGSRPGFRQ
jgi:hypothetical protein